MNFEDELDGIAGGIRWKHLPVPVILQNCWSRTNFEHVCEDNNTWIYLLKRDFNKNYRGSDAKYEYMYLYEIYKDYQQYLSKIGYDPDYPIENYPMNKLKGTIENIYGKTVNLNGNIIDISQLRKNEIRKLLQYHLSKLYPSIDFTRQNSAFNLSSP